MGINNCLEFIRKKYPHLLKVSHISTYAYQRVIVDIASYVYKFACIYGLCTRQWTDSFIQLCLQFKTNRVHPVIVFDGKAPKQKADELKERRDKKQQTISKVKLLEECLAAVRSGIYTEDQYSTLQEYSSSLESKGKLVSTKRLLVVEDESSVKFTPSQLDQIEGHINKLKNTVVHITPEHTKYMKEVLTMLGIPYLDAEGEAEDYCCFLVRKGFGTAVVSYDTDCIAHMATNIIFKMDTFSGEILHCNTDEIVEEWELDKDSIKDFAILVGCDYNRKQKAKQMGTGIGPVTAINWLQSYGSIEHIPGLQISQEEVDTMRSLFQIDYPIADDFVIPSLSPDFELCDMFISFGKCSERVRYQLEECSKPASIALIETEELEEPKEAGESYLIENKQSGVMLEENDN